MTIAIISHNSCQLHDNGSPYHPECAERLGAIQDRMISSGMDWVVAPYDAEPAKYEDLARVHTNQYIDSVYEAAPSEGIIELDGDTNMSPRSLEAALHSAGAAVMAVDLVMANQHKKAFCTVRPPGHHAKRGNAAGFCIFNNIAVGAAYALDHYGLERVAIVDFDVHHGDGTEDIVKDEARVLFCSSFQHPYYPNSGFDTDLPNILNEPLPAGTTGAQWRKIVSEKWLPAINDFKPQLIMISAGFDSHLEDEMGGFKFVEKDYIWITEELCNLAKTHCEGRVISCLEGGYEMSSLGRSVVAHIKAMAEAA